MAVTTSISVIIPTLNEADSLPSTLAELANCQAESVIIVDGGSTDQTTEIATNSDTLLITTNAANRAIQLNRGAAQSNADILLFLHADTKLNAKAFNNLLNAIEADPYLAGGGFSRGFESNSLILKLTCRLSSWRSRKWGIFLGDQGIFVRRNVFEQLGGFAESISIGEDLDFSLRLRQNKFKTICIGPPILSSARRFKKRGPLCQTLVDFWLGFRIIRSR